jgi:hypothetical protein
MLSRGLDVGANTASTTAVPQASPEQCAKKCRRFGPKCAAFSSTCSNSSVSRNCEIYLRIQSRALPSLFVHERTSTTATAGWLETGNTPKTSCISMP